MVVQKSHPIVKPLGVKKRNGMNYSNDEHWYHITKIYKTVTPKGLPDKMHLHFWETNLLTLFKQFL